MSDEPEQSVMAADRRCLSAISNGIAFITAGAVVHLLCWAVVVLLLQLIAGGASARQFRAGEFDYYALALSWSPTYCVSKAGENDTAQCAPGRHFAFVVHGLWPQFESGWPENCATEDTTLPEAEIAAMLPIMPSRQLMIHEWKKHGSCSGLAPADYFAKTRALFERIKIPARYLSPNSDLLVTPAQVIDDFVKTNPDLAAAMISLQCGNRSDRGRLSDLRVCFDRQGTLRACGENERRQCRAKTLVLPRVR
jgi:ribonuclease T2